MANLTGIQAIANALKVTASLTTILVGGNELGDEGTTILCDALRKSTVTKVQELGLEGNDIGPEGAKAVAAMAAVVASLTQVLAIDRKLCCFTFLGLTFTHHRCPLCVLDSLICQSTHCAVWTSMARAPTPLRA